MLKVTAGIIEKDGKILIAKRRKDDPLKDKWEFPGGKIESDETPEECLKRELHEELGIEAEIGEYIASTSHTYIHVSVELLFFKVKSISGNIRAKDHQEVRWTAPDDLDRYDFPEADRPVIEILQKR
jgi:8-oxo-dGTP diphosphatase